jgi:hypothetical protein
MPAFANIVINDGSAVAHTFGPANLDTSQQNGQAIYADRVGGIAIGFPQMYLSLVPPKTPVSAGDASDASKRVYRANLTIRVPILESTSAATGTGIAPAPTVSLVTVCKVDFSLPERGTLAQRTDILAFVKNALAHTTVDTLVKTLEAVY